MENIYIYRIVDLKYDPKNERLYGKIELKGTKKKTYFNIDFSTTSYEDLIRVEDYKEDDDEDIYGVLDEFYSEHIEEQISLNVEDGNFISIKKIIFK